MLSFRTMVDSPEDEAMAARVHHLEEKLDTLAASVDQRFDAVDRRFDAVDQRFEEVDAALVEQRQYTEFAFSRLEAKMDSRFSRLERKLDQFIDTQTETNRLVELRLGPVKRRGPR